MKLKIAKFPVISIFIMAICHKADAYSNYINMSLPEGINLAIPSDWMIFGESERRSIQNKLNNVIDTPNTSVVMIASGSYGSLGIITFQIQIVTPPSHSPQRILNLSPKDLKRMRQEDGKALGIVYSQIGTTLINMRNTTKGKFANLPAIFTNLTCCPNGKPRSEASIVDTTIIGTNTRTIKLIFTYKEKGKQIFVPMIKMLKNTIKIR